MVMRGVRRRHSDVCRCGQTADYVDRLQNDVDRLQNGVDRLQNDEDVARF